MHESLPPLTDDVSCLPPEPFFRDIFHVTEDRSVGHGSPSLHSHDRLEIGYCYAGSGVFYVRNESYPYSAGDITLVYPGEKHDIRCSTSQNVWRFICPDIPALYANYPDRERILSLITDDRFQGHICTRREHKVLLSYVQQMIHVSRYNPEEAERQRPYLTALLSCLLYETERLQPLEKFDKTYHNASLEMTQQIQPAVMYLHNNFTEQIRIADLSALCYISEGHLRRGFSAVYGISPIEYLHRLRIKYACGLLTNTKTSIMSVAGQCGYTSVSSFNRQFRKFMHITPLEYRKKFNNWQVSG